MSRTTGSSFGYAYWQVPSRPSPATPGDEFVTRMPPEPPNDAEDPATWTGLDSGKPCN